VLVTAASVAQWIQLDPKDNLNRCDMYYTSMSVRVEGLACDSARHCTARYKLPEHITLLLKC